MNKIIKIFEDKTHKTLELTAQQKKDINKMKKYFGDSSVILQDNGHLLVKHYVGFIQVNKTRLLVYPKISTGVKSELYFGKSFEILLKMLKIAKFINIKNTNTTSTYDVYKDDLLEVFINLFITELLKQFSRDINRGYKNVSENQTFVKGKIDFTETFKQNSYRKHLHMVKYNHFTENVLLNAIFKTVILKLINITNDSENKKKLRQSLLWLEDVQITILNKQIWEKVKFNRNNKNYEIAYNMAKLLANNSSANINVGDEKIISFLIPVNELFEKYLFEILKLQNNQDIEVEYQKPTKYLATNIKTNTKVMKLKPDITMSRDEKVQIILDAKYKDMNNHNQNDIYQMLAYSVGYQCNNIALVYPKYLDNQINEMLIGEYSIKNNNQKILIKKLQLDLEKDPKQLSDNIFKELLTPIAK